MDNENALKIIDSINRKIREKYNVGDISDVPEPVYLFEFISYRHEYFGNEKVYEATKDISFNEFTQSNYWKIIRRYIIYTRKSCEKCNSKELLYVTYKSNDIPKGFEHKNLDKLILLCEKCYIKHCAQGIDKMKPKTRKEKTKQIIETVSDSMVMDMRK